MGSSPTARTNSPNRLGCRSSELTISNFHGRHWNVGSNRESQLVNQAPDIPVCLRQLFHDGFDLVNCVIVNRVFPPEFDVGLAIRNAHQNCFGIPALLVEGIDAMIELVSNSGKFAETLRVLQYRVANVRGSAVHFCQPLDQINSGSGRVQREKNYHRDVFGGSRKTGDEVNEQAFGIRPHIVQPANQQDQAVEPFFETVSQRKLDARRAAQPQNRNGRLRSGC